MSTNLEESLYAVLDEGAKPPDPRAFGSEAGGCSRAIWWRMHGEPVTDPPPLSTLIAFAVGNALHERVAAAYRRWYGSQTQTEVSWVAGHVAGRADIAVTTLAGHRRLVEVKTISPFEVKYLREPKREHLLQLALYALALDIPDGDIIYLNKVPRSGESPFLAFEDVLDDDTWREAENEMARLETIATAETLPDAHTGEQALDPRGDAWNCRYCRWRTRCLAEVQS